MHIMEAFMKSGSNKHRARRSGTRTRELILSRATDMLIELGYERTTVAELAKSLGMSPANVFKHFGSKAELASAVIADRLSRETSLGSAAKQCRWKFLLFSRLKELVDFSREEPRLYEVIATMMSAEDAGTLLRQRMLKELQQAVTDVRLPCERDAFIEALSDVFLCVLHPAMIAGTDEAALRKRAENVALLVELAITNGKAQRKNKISGRPDGYL